MITKNDVEGSSMLEMRTPSYAKKPLLTIAIPTYNREICLGELLESLLPQLIGETEIELLISDNCSTDGTASMLGTFHERGLQFRYLRTESNVGPDANFLQCFTQADGKYFWLIGSDDIVVPNAVTQIVSLLQQGETTSSEQKPDFDLVFLSSFGFTGSYQQRQDSRFNDPLGRFAEILTDGQFFLKRVNALISLISAVIVNKNSLIRNGHLPLRELNNTNLSQLAWIFPLIKKKSRILYIWERLVGYRVYNSGGWKPCQVFGVNLQHIASMYFVAEPRLVKSLLNSTLRYCIPVVLGQMRQGQHPFLISEDCTGLLQPLYRDNWRYWVFSYPILVCPLWSVRVLYQLINLVNKITRSCQILWHHLFSETLYVGRP